MEPSGRTRANESGASRPRTAGRGRAFAAHGAHARPPALRDRDNPVPARLSAFLDRNEPQRASRGSSHRRIVRSRAALSVDEMLAGGGGLGVAYLLRARRAGTVDLAADRKVDLYSRR